ncbi:Alpha/Beta hydrolase protein [Armillaria novae-zelandiae]|uniref:Alpha/Beta hydrolase protein n=1 Tax=Armillaria novae-zelandiae TaxID=153914 RepID=A0AA39PXW0_9AGAR|nr:Alpha/Beta hydrolase protein [Armillaria novae-zelandiae]
MAQLTFSQRATLFLAVCHLTIRLPWRLCTSFFTREHNKSWRQICTSVLMSTVVTQRFRKGLPVTESITNYASWTATTGLEANVEELCNGAKLLWIGPKYLDRVMLYCHGGGYMLNVGPNTFSWLRHMQLELQKRDIDVGIAIVAYNLLPNAVFPSRLREATDGFNHLRAAGVLPENIILGGDSAGGNLALQLLSHILHPMPSIEVVRATRLRGLLLLSPFVGAQRTSEMPLSQLEALHKRDFLPAEFHSEVCLTFLKDVPKDGIAYADGLAAPEEWFKPSDEAVGRILVTTGEWDFLEENTRLFYERHLKPLHRDVKLVVEKDGEHVSPLLDFVLKGDVKSTLTPLIVEWLADTFKARPITGLDK